MPSVLFVCTANRFRSPLAAAVLRKNLEQRQIGDSWRVESAGTWATPGQPALPEVYEAAQRIGIDLSAHRSRRLSRDLLSGYDLILVMQASQQEALLTEFPELQERVYLLSYVVERRSYDVTETIGAGSNAMDVVLELDSLVQRGVESICVLATYLNNTRHPSDR